MTPLKINSFNYITTGYLKNIFDNITVKKELYHWKYEIKSKLLKTYTLVIYKQSQQSI